MLVGFGNLSALACDFENAFPNRRVITAKTVAAGIAESESECLLIQPIYLLPGFEYNRLCAEAAEFARHAVVGRALLSSDENIATLSEILKREYRQESTLFVGHGSHHPLGEAVYAKLSDMLPETAFIGVLEGNPDYKSVVNRLRQCGIFDLTLASLTLTAGKHVWEDIFGDDAASWESRLCMDGFLTASDKRTLLDFSDIRQMFVTLCRASYV